MATRDGLNDQGEVKTASEPGRLVVVSGPRNGSTITLSSEATTLGRQSENDVVVDDAAVSRRHAVIAQTRAGYHIRDLDSTNGTFVNQERIGIAGHLLAQGDVIRLGGSETSFKFQHPGATTLRLPTVERPPDVVSVDVKARQVFVMGELLDPPVAKKEFDLLALLDSRRSEAVSRDDIASAVWPERPGGDVGNHEIEQCVRRLRLRIEEDPSQPRRLVTVRGFGYKLS